MWKRHLKHCFVKCVENFTITKLPRNQALRAVDEQQDIGGKGFARGCSTNTVINKKIYYVAQL